MTHGITEQDWIDYLEGELAAAERDRLESHLIGCVACWELYEQLAKTRLALQEAGEEARRAFPLTDEQLHAGMRRVLARITAEENAGRPFGQHLADAFSVLQRATKGMSHFPLSALWSRPAESELARPVRNIPAGVDPVRARLHLLEAVLAPMCGSRTATNALRAAAKDSPAHSLERVTRDNWAPFLASLTSIAVVMCGETGARLIRESGQW
jgi:anti-sigma factor RsiW